MHKLQQDIMSVYKKVKEKNPGLSHLSFEVTDFCAGPMMHGWVHIGERCESFDTMAEFAALVDVGKNRAISNEVLFRQF